MPLSTPAVATSMRRRAAIGAVVMTSCAVAACNASRCENQAFYGLPSPDATMIAFVFHRRCGAPVRISTEVSLVAFHDSLRNAPGNVLSVDGEQSVKVTWHGPRTLVVSGADAPTLRRTEPLENIAIEFQ